MSRVLGTATATGDVGTAAIQSSTGRQGAAVLDTLDMRIAAALQADGRARWREIARMVGASETTVSRRATAMFAKNLIRSTIAIDPQRCGLGHAVVVQFNCMAGHSTEVASALAARPDARFVALVTGPFDVVAEFIVSSRNELASLLADDLGSTSGVSHLTTEVVLRNFKASHDWSRELLGGAAPPPEPPRGKVEAVQLDAVDRDLIALLGSDARQSNQQLADALGVSESMARRRIDRLIAQGCLLPATLVEPALLGYEIEVFALLKVDLGKLEAIAAQLAAVPSVRYLSATSGFTDLVAEVILRSHDELYNFQTRVLGHIDGIREANVALEIRTLKRAFLPGVAA